MSKFRREEPPSLAKHKHCPACGTPIELNKQYCSEKCRQANRSLSRSRTRNFILITVGIIVFWIILVFLQPH